MFFYLLLMIFILTFGLLMEKRNKKAYVVIISILLILISGLRKYTVGIDSEQYYFSYKMIGELSWENLINTRYEYGYALFCRILNLISNNSQILFFISSIINIVAISKLIYKYSTNATLSFFIYVALGIFFSSMNVLRQTLALSIVLFGIDFLLKNKKKIFVIFVIIAAQFHSTAYVALLLLIPAYMKFTDKKLLVIFIISVISFLLGKTIFAFLSNYIEQYQTYDATNFAFENYFATGIYMIQALIFLIFGRMAMKKNLNNENNSDYKLYNLLIFATCFYFSFEMIAIRANIMERLSQYFSVFSVVLIPASIKNLNIITNKKIYSILFVSLLFLENMAILCFRPYWYGVSPYKFFWM